MLLTPPRIETYAPMIRREVHAEVLTGKVLVRIGVEHKDERASRAFVRKFYRGTPTASTPDGWYSFPGRDVFFPLRRIPEVVAALWAVHASWEREGTPCEGAA